MLEVLGKPPVCLPYCSPYLYGSKTDRKLFNFQGPRHCNANSSTHKRRKERTRRLFLTPRIMRYVWRYIVATTTTSVQERLYTIAKACELLGFGKTTLYKEKNAGRLLSVKVGRKTLIPQSSITLYIDNKIEEARQFRAQNPGRWS